MNHKDNIIKLIQEIGHRHGVWQVYSDFLELSAIAISNAVDKSHFAEREQRYLDIIQRYSKNEVSKITQIFNELINALEVDIEDVLGKIFNELGLSNKWLGQFFTPFQISLAAGKMMLHDLKDTINKNGYVTVNEPTVGGGSMILGMCKAMLEDEINYQKHMLVVAQDLDIRAVFMSYVQLSLAGVPAIIIHGNSLLVEARSHWYTPMYVLDGWKYRFMDYKVMLKESDKNKRAQENKENKKAG